MEFKFSVNELFKNPIVEINHNLIPPGFSGDRRALWDSVNKVSEVINAMGEASAKAQGLSKPITTADRLRNSEHRLYILLDQQANNGKGAVTGMLKTGAKGLYVFDRDGQHYQVSPPCVLDFYVHDSRQRTGLGKQLFEHMLQKEGIEPVKMAIDRPSEKLLGFLNKHYGLHSPVKQMNNYVVYDGFFSKASDSNQHQEVERDQSPAGTRALKKDSANGLQTSSSPYGRYGAPRPPCSMGQIIHNQTSTINKQQEPSGVQSMPAMGAHQQQYGYTQSQNVSQSVPNIQEGRMINNPNYIQTQVSGNYAYAQNYQTNPQYGQTNRQQYVMESNVQNPKHLPQIADDVYVYRQDSQQQNYAQDQQTEQQNYAHGSQPQQQSYTQGPPQNYAQDQETNQTFSQSDVQYGDMIQGNIPPHYQIYKAMQGDCQYMQQQPQRNQMTQQQIQGNKLMQLQPTQQQQAYVLSHVTQSAPQLSKNTYNQGLSMTHPNHGPVSNMHFPVDHQQMHQQNIPQANAFVQHQVANTNQIQQAIRTASTVSQQQVAHHHMQNQQNQQNIPMIDQVRSMHQQNVQQMPAYNQQQVSQQTYNEHNQSGAKDIDQMQIQQQPNVQQAASTFGQHAVAQQMQNQQYQPVAQDNIQESPTIAMHQQPQLIPTSAYSPHQADQQMQNQQIQPTVQSTQQNARNEMSLIMTGEQYQPGDQNQPIVHPRSSPSIHQHASQQNYNIPLHISNDTNLIQQQANTNQHHHHNLHQQMPVMQPNVNLNTSQYRMVQQVASNILQQSDVSMHSPINQSMTGVQQQSIIQPHVSHVQNLNISGAKSEQQVKSNIPPNNTASATSVQQTLTGNAGYVERVAPAGGDMKQTGNKLSSKSKVEWTDEDSLRNGYPPQLPTVKPERLTSYNQIRIRQQS
ncbi:unnamed protein product [Acanthoscelides obtectus]|uniref:Alpha-tubulin N-acetyltransferase n=1 Tax=Acanthoscelides obtectus TaxID=200917 RepID=A0A9P0K601_ACAOB|nr:unnamed protein product [Acanthoscelides obtectus]CAK1631163.1 Alpha-tubulin N-acetyltransferase [Acanthoscelides obtectus]